MRDPLRQNRFGSSFKVTYPDFPGVNLPVRSITINQEIGKHDIVELYYSRISSAIIRGLKTGVPVEILWGNDKMSEKFYGYAVDVSYPTVQKIERGIKVTVIGASYPLKERTSKIWINKTASDIALDIAKRVKLKPFVTPSPIRFTQQSLAGHSYWEKLNELANRIGYGVQVIGTELHFHPIDEMVNLFMTTIPVMSFKNPFLNPMSVYNAPTLDMFEPKIGDYIETNDYSRTGNTVGGVDPISGKVYKSSSSPNTVGKNFRENTKAPLFSSIETSTVIASKDMSKYLSEARAQMARLSIPAKGIGQGDPRIAPWRTIEVRGTGDTSDGFWIIKQVEHFLHIDGRYQVEFTCATDGVGKNKPSAYRPSTAGSVPVRNVKKELVTANKRKPTSTKLSAPTTIVSQNIVGYKVTPRTWKGK
jgi:hypothetical protein